MQFQKLKNSLSILFDNLKCSLYFQPIHLLLSILALLSIFLQRLLRIYLFTLYALFLASNSSSVGSFVLHPCLYQVSVHQFWC